MQRKRLLLHLWCSFVLLLVCQISYAQPRSVTGTVTDEKGAPLSGATIMAKGAKNNTTTNASGKFEVVVPEGVNALVVSYIGYETKEVSLAKGSNRLDVVLKT